MKAWLTKALELLKASLEPPKHELNEMDWKAGRAVAGQESRLDDRSSTEKQAGAQSAKLGQHEPGDAQKKGASANRVNLLHIDDRSAIMGAAERIAELIKAMHEREIAEMVDFAEFLLARRGHDTTDAWITLDKYAGRYDGGKWRREELYDRAGLR